MKDKKYYQMYEDYKTGWSLQEVGKMYGITRQAVYSGFKCRGFKLREKKVLPFQIFNEIKFILRNTGYYGTNKEGKGKLYLMNKGFQTKHLKQLLEEIDSNKNFSPASIIVFGYHFESKNLREIAENVASYANKKKLDIDFITRY